MAILPWVDWAFSANIYNIPTSKITFRGLKNLERFLGFSEKKKEKNVRCANAQPFLCNEMGPFEVILGKFHAIRGPLSGNLQATVRRLSGDCQAISGNFR